MYKRKFSKPKTVAIENDFSSYPKSSTNSSHKTSSSFDTPSMSVISNLNISNDEDSLESCSMLEDFCDLPSEKKKKTMMDNYEDNTSDGSELLFDENDDPHAYLKQTLFSCGLHLKCDQNILSK